MKKMVSFLFALALSTFALSVWAQGQTLSEAVNRTNYGDNWFISLGGSANLLMAEQDAAYALNKRITYGGALTLGKWFNQGFGMRVQVNGGALRGFNYVDLRHPGYFTGGFHKEVPMGGSPKEHFGDPENSNYKYVDPKPKYRENDGYNGAGFLQEFNYGQATIDLMFNLTNLLRGHYRENNFFDLIPYTGVGLITAYSNKYTTPDFYMAVLKLGFRANFNLNPNWSIYLEPQVSATDPEFDGYKGTAVGDAVANLSLGLQYTFNKGFANIGKLTLDEVDRLNKKVNENRYLIENQQDILERQQNLLDKLQKCCDEEKVVTQVIEKTSLPEYIRFVLDSYVIEQPEQRKLIDVIDYLKKTPDAKLLLIGYADKKTGNPRHNLELSQKRVDAVAAELKRSGINPNRLIVDWKGDKEQPFVQNDWNRVVIMVERK
jgi:outer membrane protein OmpA-like peptidoglycan-associated protein